MLYILSCMSTFSLWKNAFLPRSCLSVRRRTINDGRLTENDTIRNDIEVTRKLLRELQDHVDKLERDYVLRLQDNTDIIFEERYKLIINKLILLLSVQKEACALENSNCLIFPDELSAH